MTAWHVAIEQLRDEIATRGLDPADRRAILLLPEMPEPAEGFDVWEVDADVCCSDGSASFLAERIGPERVRLCRNDLMPGW
mgnify:FL=1